MQKFIEAHQEKYGTYTPAEIAQLAAICGQVKEQLGLTDRGEIDRAAARILVLYDQGLTDPDRIVRTVVIAMSIDKAKG